MNPTFNFTSFDMFSGMLSLFAAIIGLAYPFILQVRSQIKSRYISEKVIDWFLNEPWFRSFLCILRINIPIAILNPFLLYLFRKTQWDFLSITLLVIQANLLTVLLFYLMRLYDLIDIFCSYIKMANHTNEEYLERLAIVMLSADHWNNNDGYRVARDKLYKGMYECIKQDGGNRNDRIVVFPENVLKALGMILFAAEKKQKYPHTSIETTPISFLYDIIYNKVHLTKELRIFIWSHLARLLWVGNTDWLKSYWEWASQYYRTMYYNIKFDEQERKDFFEMHIFFAAMVLRSNNKELMEYIMTNQDASPESPCLLLHSLKKIVDNLLYYDNQRFIPFRLTELYPMEFFANDVNTDDKIFRVLCDYLALLQLNLIAYGNKFTYNNGGTWTPKTDCTIEELEHDKNILIWFKDTVLANICKKLGKYYTKEQNEKAFAQLVQIIELYTRQIFGVKKKDCEKVLEAKKNNCNSEVNLQAISVYIIDENKERVLPFFYGKKDGHDVEYLSFNTKVVIESSQWQLVEQNSSLSIAFAESLVAKLRYQFYVNFASLFLLNSPRRTFLIQYKDVRKALEKLNFSNDKHILFNYAGSFLKNELNDENIIDLLNNKNCFFIMKKENYPTYTYGTLDYLNSREINSINNGDIKYTKLDAANGLYWKESTKKDKLLIDVVQPYILYFTKLFKYIKINITYDQAIGDCSLHELKNLKEYLG